MGYGIDILNTIRTTASSEYQSLIPVATQENFSTIGFALSEWSQVQNEFFTALWNKIGLTMLDQMQADNFLGRFKRGKRLDRKDIEEIFIDMIHAEGKFDNKGLNPLGRRDYAKIHTMYHRENRQDTYCITIGDTDCQRIFNSESTLESFVQSQIEAMWNGITYDELVFTKNLLASYKDDYFQVQVPSFTDSTDLQATAKQFVKRVRKVAKDMTFANKLYNKAGVLTKSKKSDLVLLINKDLTTETDVELLASAYNSSKTDIPFDMIEMDDFGSMQNTYALLVDKKFFMIFDTLNHFESQRNAQGMFTNYFYHIFQIYSLSKFKQAVRFTTDTVSA